MSNPKNVQPNCGCNYQCKCNPPVDELHILGPLNYRKSVSVKFKETEIQTIKNEIAGTFGIIYSHFLNGSSQNNEDIALIRDNLINLLDTYSEGAKTISDMITREMNTMEFMKELNNAVAFVNTNDRDNLLEQVDRLKCQIYTFYKLIGI